MASIATQAARVAEAPEDAGCIDLDPYQLGEILVSLDSAAARIGGVCDRLAEAMDQARIAG
jgi:hypothetical protein